jgi:hypothetical protein
LGANICFVGEAQLAHLVPFPGGPGRHRPPGNRPGWLDNNKDSTVLRQLATGERPLTHAALDELPDGEPLRG